MLLIDKLLPNTLKSYVVVVVLSVISNHSRRSGRSFKIFTHSAQLSQENKKKCFAKNNLFKMF